MTKIARFGEIGNWKKYLDGISKSGDRCAKSLFFHEWAVRPVQLSDNLMFEDYPVSEKFEDGPAVIEKIMCQIDSMFNKHPELNKEYLEERGFRAYLLDRFRDPGLLHHCVFWDFGKDPEAITFEWLHSHGEGQMCREMLQGKDLNIFDELHKTDADQSPWKHLLSLYHEKVEPPRDEDDPGLRLFTKVLGWPLS